MKAIIINTYNSLQLNANKLQTLPNLRKEDVEKIARYKTELGQREEAVSAYFKRKYVGDFFISDKGKPLSSNTYFNISHSNGLVIFSKNDKPIGIDIEKVEKIEDDIKSFVMSDDEYEDIKEDEDFFKKWVSKESLLKAVGSGMVRAVKEVPSTYDGKKEYNGKTYYSHLIKYNEFFISVTIEDVEDFNIKMQIEEINL